MIRIERQTEPAIFTSPGVRNKNERAKEFYGGRNKSRSQSRFEFETLNHKQVREALWENFNNKCAFCESHFVTSVMLNMN